MDVTKLENVQIQRPNSCLRQVWPDQQRGKIRYPILSQLQLVVAFRLSIPPPCDSGTAKEQTVPSTRLPLIISLPIILLTKVIVISSLLSHANSYDADQFVFRCHAHQSETSMAMLK